MTLGQGQRWYVVQSHPHAEATAVRHLERQGFATYLPRYLKRRSHARRIDVVAAPLFPRYLFVAIDQMSQRWRAVRSTIGVYGLLCSGDEPLPVADRVISQLKAQEDERGWIALRPPPRFVQGDKVVVIDGVFATCLGLFEGMADKDRVAILLELLGRKVRIVLDGEAIAAA